MSSNLEELLGKITRKGFLLLRKARRFPWIDSLSAEAFQVWYEMPFPPTHYYSPLPDRARLLRKMNRWYQESTMPGIDMRAEAQLALLDSLTKWKLECTGQPRLKEVTAKGYGPGYGQVEADLLHCMIREFKPRRIIEVGSGVSTWYAANAVELNHRESGPPASITCIEPYPFPELRSFATAGKIQLLVDEVQNVALSRFRELETNDILFIDSSHAGKVDSDVYFLYLEVLPVLKPGVIIHIHDVYFPFPTCPPAHAMFGHSIYWNESAILMAFLAFNRTYEVLMCQSWLHLKSSAALQKVSGEYQPERHLPTSLWLRKVSG